MENVTPTNDQLTDLQRSAFCCFESEENSESVMDGFVEHPFYTATLNGQKICSDENKGMTVTGKI